MSEAISALAGASYDGYVKVREAGLRGMITVRGDLSSAELKSAVTGVTGTDFPAARSISLAGEQGIAWMSPDELLVMMPYAKAAEVAKTLETALKGSHALVANVSDARVTFTVAGSGAREVLAKLTPADLRPGVMKPGEIRRSRFAQVAAAFWMINDTDFEVVSFRSTAQSAFDLLKTSAKPGGEVGLF